DLIKRAQVALRERSSQRLEELRRLAREAGYEVTLTRIGEDTGRRKRGQPGKSGKREGDRRRSPVQPKYRNPDNPSETWSGRGRQPRWLVAQLRAGGRIDDFSIKRVANKR